MVQVQVRLSRAQSPAVNASMACSWEDEKDGKMEDGNGMSYHNGEAMMVYVRIMGARYR